MPVADHPRVVVTGGASGLGRAFANHVASLSGSVLIADRDTTGAEETLHEVEKNGGKGFVIKTDVARAAEVEALVAKAREALGGVDVMINNAGVAVGGPIGEVPLADWQWIIDINLNGVVFGCHFFAPIFKAQRSGHFINIASLAAIAQAPNMGPYNVTKAGVVALSETLSGELAGFGAGVTVVCPSFFQTNLMNGSRSTKIDATGFVSKLMKKSRIQAGDVARIAFDAAAKNRLYALPHREGQVLWALKRLAPTVFHSKIIGRAGRRITE